MALDPDPRNSMPARTSAAALPEAAKRFEFIDVNVFSFSFNIADVLKRKWTKWCIALNGRSLTSLRLANSF
jgi:hypothetical protein